MVIAGGLATLAQALPTACRYKYYKKANNVAPYMAGSALEKFFLVFVWNCYLP